MIKLTKSGNPPRLLVKSVCLILAFFILSFSAINISAEDTALDLDARSVILMEASTGMVLYENNADEALPPASVTKIMTLLLIMEAIDAGTLKMTDMISVSAHAASMGGSQVYLKEGESMTAEDLIKSIVIASANDATVAMAEHIAGSEEAFVARMNERAAQLGMSSSHFENTNGLDDSVSNHVTSARDIAIMSRELIRHEKILEYSSIWMDSIRGGAFGLTNTNRLIRFYNGATGLKTGSTSKAKFCISATATRGGMSLIAVVMASPTRDIRNETAKKLLDWGFANYCVYVSEAKQVGSVRVMGGVQTELSVSHPRFSAVLKKGEDARVQQSVNLEQSIPAPVRAGERVGEVVFTCDGREIGRVGITADVTVDKISFWGVLGKIFKMLVG